MTIKLLGRASSYNVQKVLWLLEELDVVYEHTECGGRFGGLDTAEFHTINPFQKAPVLIDNGKSIWESNTILRYLAAPYGNPEWWSESPLERSEYEI